MDNFNWKQYISNYKDLRDAGIETKEKAVYHYVHFGKKENRNDKSNRNYSIKINKLHPSLSISYMLQLLYQRKSIIL